MKSAAPAPDSWDQEMSARNLIKSDLGGVIFVCNDNTISECFSKQLFGMPSQHFSYVKNIEPGLPLFLFNQSDKRLHGIFEAVSAGQMNINPYAWTMDGTAKTIYPAQVQVRLRKPCRPLLEDKFKTIIRDNYFTQNHFWFELDHSQASKLSSLFSSLAAGPMTCLPHISGKWNNAVRVLPSSPKRVSNIGHQAPVGYGNNCSPSENTSTSAVSLCIDRKNQAPDGCLSDLGFEKSKDHIFMKLRELAINKEQRYPNLLDCVDKTAAQNGASLRHNEDSIEAQTEENNKKIAVTSLGPSGPPIVTQLLLDVNELKAFKTENLHKINSLEHKLAQAETEIEKLKHRCSMLENILESSTEHADAMLIEPFEEVHLDPHEVIYLVGGHDGQSCLSTLDCYSPSHDIRKSLKPMNSERSHSSLTKLSKAFYAIGGGNSEEWIATVEAYDPAEDQWTMHPSLTDKKGSLAAATLNEKLFAIGGGNGVECFSDVEMFDFGIGRWILTRSMLQKRFSLAATELNGAIYAVGGYDGKNYLNSAERFDPREHAWTRIESMGTKRGCHSLAILDDKLFALGGHDGNTMVNSVEIFEPRTGTWTNGEPMKHSRGYAAVAVLKGSIYAIGGINSDPLIVKNVECYEEGRGWREIKTTKIGNCCYSSAIVL